MYRCCLSHTNQVCPQLLQLLTHSAHVQQLGNQMVGMSSAPKSWRSWGQKRQQPKEAGWVSGLSGRYVSKVEGRREGDEPCRRWLYARRSKGESKQHKEHTRTSKRERVACRNSAKRRGTAIRCMGRKGTRDGESGVRRRWPRPCGTWCQAKQGKGLSKGERAVQARGNWGLQLQPRASHRLSASLRRRLLLLLLLLNCNSPCWLPRGGCRHCRCHHGRLIALHAFCIQGWYVHHRAVIHLHHLSHHCHHVLVLCWIARLLLQHRNTRTAVRSQASTRIRVCGRKQQTQTWASRAGSKRQQAGQMQQQLWHARQPAQ